MLQELRHEAWSLIDRTFPERQIYIRSDGRVQFFTFDPLMQAICAASGFLLLGWVAFTSVNVIFKDRIIDAKERHFIELQAAYEARLSDLQISYDELNGALAAAESRFQMAADAFESKQQTLANLIRRKQDLQISLSDAPPRNPPAKPAPSAQGQRVAYLGMNFGLGPAIEDIIPNLAKNLTPFRSAAGPLWTLPAFGLGAAVSEGGAAPLESQRATFFDGAVRRIGEFFGRPAVRAETGNPAFRRIAGYEARLAVLDESNPALAAEAGQDFDKEVTRLTRVVRNTGLDPKTLSAGGELGGQGGPALGLGQAFAVTADEAFNSRVQGAIGSLNALGRVVAALRTIPLDTPLEDDTVTSGFGGRPDPLTESFEYHTGLDFSGAKGSAVHVTAPGVVVFAERFGAYGNMVEVDHGNRIRTRYAHLLKIGVPVGRRLEKGDVVGELGSTGRSTGPHVHYEIWHGNTAKDPQRFIKAGRNVLKIQ